MTLKIKDQVTMYLYNKNILEYVELVRTEPKSMIHDNEGHSTSY